MQLSFDLKKTILSHFFVFVVVFCLSFFIEIEISQAIIYNPGETLNPACSPSDLNCDVRSGVNVPSGAGAGSLVYATSTDVYNTLSIGSNGQILKVKNGGLSWSNDEAIQAMGKAGGQTIIGGTEANNALVIQANSATLGNNDYSTAIKFKVGNNGVTEALTILNNGNININGDISMAGDIIPAADNVYSLGSPTKVWRDVYIGPGSLYVNGQKVLQTDDSDNVAITADVNQSLLMKTFGTGDIELNPSGSGQILLKGDLRLSSDKRFVGTVNFDNLIFTENTISTRNLNGGISLTPNGMGGVYVTNGNFGIGTTSPAEKLDLVGNLKISGALMPAGSAGSSGQFLVSQGAGLAPLWISYNTTNWNTAYSWGNHTGLYDLLGTASSSLTTHETAYNHSLIATALQSELDPIWNSEKGTYALKSEIPTLSNLTVSSFATSTISQWVNNVGYTTLSSFSASTPLSYNSTSGIFSLAKSDSLTDGYLSSVDWNIFNSKIGTTTGDWLGSWQGKNSSDFAASTTISSQWATNGSDVSYGAGNVGIGTTTPNQQLEITKNFRLPSTVGASRYGVIYKDDVPFIHDFAYGLNSNGITPEGNNTFIGRNSGNFTMGSTATSASQASYNLGIGAFSLQGNTLGTQNVGIGLSALRNNTTGVSNFALGGDSLFSNSTGSYNVGIGNNTLRSASLTNFNLGIGFSALRFITSGDNNIGIGYNAGRYISNGATTLTSSSGGIFIGTEARPLANNSSNEIVIGYNTVGLGSNTAVIGNSDITTTVLRGNIGVGITNPSFNLDITNTINVSSRYRINGQAYAYWNTTAPNLPSGMTAAVELGYAGVGPSSNFPTRLNANLNSYLQAYNNGTDTSFTFIGGNVGIGTTTPGMKLSVLATDSAKAMEIIGSSGGYANIDITGSRTSGNLGGLRFVRSGDAVGFFEMNPQANKSATYFSTGDGTVAPTVKLALLQNGNTGIGTVNPLSPLHISNIGTSSLSTTFSGAIGTQGSFISAKNGLNAIYNISADNGPANRPTMVFLRSRGTLTTPSNVAENDTLGDLLFGGIGGSSVNYGGGVFAYVDGTPTASSVPTRISFVTGGSAALRSERLVIKNDGKIGIGTTSPAYKLDVEGDARFTTGLTIDSLGTGALYSNAGILTNTDPSDINLKQNILNINNSLSKIMSLRPVSFEWKNTGELSQGFIAQEVETILPELVGQNPGGYKGLYTTRFIPYIVSAIQEQQSLLQGQRSLLDSLSFDVSKSLNISSLNKLVLNGGLEVSGHVAFSEDTVGEVEILSGNLEMRINFKEEYLEKPIITVTPKSELAGVYWVSDVDAHGFTIKLKETQAENIAFYWHAFAKKGDFFPAPVIVPENNNSSESENIINAIEENSGAVNSESTPTPEPETLPEPVTASEPIPETIPAPEPEIAPAQASETENTPEPIQDVVTTPETINE